MSNDNLALPVSRIWDGDPAAFADSVQRLSGGLAPSGFGPLLYRYAMDAQVDARVCLAIALKETGRFAYGGTDPVFSATAAYNNFGGIKTTDSLATFRFATVPLGVHGLVAHVAWYAHPKHVDAVCGRYADASAVNTEFDPRHWAWGHTGALRTVADLGHGVWNSGTTYAPSVASLLADIGL